MKTITITVQGLLTPQGVANALTKTAAGILGNGETLQQPLGAGVQSGILKDPAGKCVGNWKLS